MPGQDAASISAFVVHTPCCALCKREHDFVYIPCKPEDAIPYDEDGRTLALLGEAMCPHTCETIYIMQVVP